MSNLRERYTFAVTRHLPPSQRKEVADELLATIEDMAADRAAHGKPKEADIHAALQELGDPAILARKYQTTQRYLISPKWYDAYVSLLKRLLSIVPGIVAALMLAFNLARGENPITGTISAIGTGIAVAVQIAFWVTLVFAMLERYTKPEHLNSTNWSPDQLPHLPKNATRQINTVESIIAAALIALGMLWLVLTPMLHVKDGIPLLNPQIWEFWAPLFLVLAGLALAHKLWLLMVGNWTTPLMVTHLLLCAASIVYIVAIATTQQIINLEYFHAWGSAISNEDLVGIVHLSTNITVVALVADYVWESVKSIILNRRFVKNK